MIRSKVLTHWNMTASEKHYECERREYNLKLGLLQWFSCKESACNAEDTGDMSSIPGSGRSPGGGNGNPFQYSCLENPLDREAWQATVHGVAKSQT